MFDVRVLPADVAPEGADPAEDADDSPIRFLAEADGQTLASGELHPSSPIGDETGQLISVRWNEGNVAAARAIVDAARAAARPGGEVHLTANAAVHTFLDERLALARDCGFELWQEKEGFWWADAGQELPAPEGVTMRTLTEVGATAYTEVIAGCTGATLDRVDADAIASLGGDVWAAYLFEGCLVPDEADIWFLAENPAGEPVGFVAVGAFDEERTGTIMHIGVLPAHRGNGYVDQLLRAANRAARGRGWKGMLSDVDVLNPPMTAAMERNGHRADAHPWHKWFFRRTR